MKDEYLKRFEEFKKSGDKEIIRFEEREFNELKELICEFSTSQIDIQEIKGRKIIITTDSNDFELFLISNHIPMQSLIIEKIAVTPKWNGVGTLILNWLINYSKSEGFKRIVLQNCNTEDSLNFAKSRGFTKCYDPAIELLQLKDVDELNNDYELLIK